MQFIVLLFDGRPAGVDAPHKVPARLSAETGVSYAEYMGVVDRLQDWSFRLDFSSRFRTIGITHFKPQVLVRATNWIFQQGSTSE
jgi:hypothetical protein